MTKRQYLRDAERESVIVKDEFGVNEYSLADLPGKVLTQLMLIGLCQYLQIGLPHTNWLALRSGVIPIDRRRHRPKPEPKPKVIRALSPLRCAIISTMLSYEGCRLSYDEVAKIVRDMSPADVRLWKSEPDVKLAYRELTGKREFLLPDLLERLQNPCIVN